MPHEDAKHPFRDPWFAQVPNVHRWLAGDEREPFVLGGGGHDYWFGAYYLARAVLGWMDCGRGFQQLAALGDDDVPAKVLGSGWGHRLDAMGLWAWVHGEAGLAGGRRRDAADYGDQERVRRAQAMISAFGFDGGYDALHLGSHLSSVEDALTRGADGRSSASVVRQDRRIVLLVDRIDEWPRALHGVQTTLSGSEPPSWRVDIVARRDATSANGGGAGSASDGSRAELRRIGSGTHWSAERTGLLTPRCRGPA